MCQKVVVVVAVAITIAVAISRKAAEVAFVVRLTINLHTVCWHAFVVQLLMCQTAGSNITHQSAGQDSVFATA